MLDLAKSSYLAPFQKLSQLIQEGRTEAVDNLRFLENLIAPCETLAAAAPKDIPAILPQILTVVRLIWRHSRFYNSAERLAGLLRKVSNEIINRCRASISMGEILDGDVQVGCMRPAAPPQPAARASRLPVPPPRDDVAPVTCLTPPCATSRLPVPPPRDDVAPVTWPL